MSIITSDFKRMIKRTFFLPDQDFKIDKIPPGPGLELISKNPPSVITTRPINTVYPDIGAIEYH